MIINASKRESWKRGGVGGVIYAASGISYSILVIAIFIGFLFPSDGFAFSLKIKLSLALLLVVFLSLPIVILVYKRALGWKGIVYPTIPLSVLLLLIYLVGSIRYYHTRQYVFDPFLQLQSPVECRSIPHKQPGEFRILFLGGSTTKNFELPPEQRYPQVVQDLLQEKYPNVSIKSINAGQDWYTTKHSLIDYITNSADCQPDLVVVMHAVNDLCRSFEPPEFTIGRYNDQWTHYYGAAHRAARPPNFELYLWNKYLRFFADQIYGKFRPIQRDYPLEHYLSIRIYERHLKVLTETIKNDQSDVILVNQPYVFKDDMTPQEQTQLVFGKLFCNRRLNFLQMEYPSYQSLKRALIAFNDVTRNVAVAESVTFVDAEADIPKDNVHFRDDVHYKEWGSKRLAKNVVEAIIKAGLIEKKMSIGNKSTMP